MAFEKVGGFGLYQVVATTGLSLLRNAGSVLIYMFAYLVFAAEYECRTDPTAAYGTCSVDEICKAKADGTELDYRIDTSYEYYLNNWQQESDLMCVPLSQVNLLIVFYCAAFGIGGVLTFPVMDKIGRRKTHYIFSTLYLIGNALIVYMPTYWGKALGYMVIGLAMSKNSLCYAWLFEFMVKETKSIASTAINTLELSVMVVSGIYFMWYSNETKPLIVGFFFVTGVLGWLITTLFITESPKWLLITGRRTEAI